MSNKRKFFLSSVVLTAALFATGIQAQNEIYLECDFDGNGAWVYFEGRGTPGFFKIDAVNRVFYFWRDNPGGGFYQAGGTWDSEGAWANLARKQLSVTEREFRLETQSDVSSSVLRLNRATGVMVINTTYPTLGKIESYVGSCNPGKDPETIAPPVNKF